MLVWIAAVVVLFYFFCLRPLNHWKWMGVAQYSCWANLAQFILWFVPTKPLTEFIQKIHNDFTGKRYCGMYQFRLPTLYIRDYELIKQLTVKDFEHFTDHKQFVPEDNEPLWEKNLFSLKGERWKDMRGTLSPSFTSSKMKIMFGLISDYAEKFVEHFQERTGTITLEMKDTFTRFTNDIIATAAFGINCDSVRYPNNEFYLMGKDITNFSGLLNNMKMVFMSIFPSTSKKLGVRFFNTGTSAFFTSIVKENVDARERNGVVRPDMIHLLMEARKDRLNEGKSLLTDDDITAQALIFFFAGFDSVSTAMCFMAHELAVNVDVQERLQHEIDKQNGQVTYEALSKMKYLDMVLSETLRKWPPAIVIDRECVKSYVIEPVRSDEKPVRIEKGEVLWISPYALHRDPNNFPDPDRFDPERFGEGNVHSYIPFGTGPRSCIGNRFALMEIKLAFFHILSKFRLIVVDKTSVPLKIDNSTFQLTAKGGFWLGLQPRNLC